MCGEVQHNSNFIINVMPPWFIADLQDFMSLFSLSRDLYIVGLV